MEDWKLPKRLEKLKGTNTGGSKFTQLVIPIVFNILNLVIRYFIAKN